MSDYDNPPSNVRLVILVTLLMEVEMPTEKPTYKVGKAIKLWDTIGGGAWSFSYHRPDGVEIWDYRLTLETYPTKEAAIDRCAQFVWNMNRTLYGGL